jgi:hypothetical protein
MLLGTKEHEMHHRGQLMLIERTQGIVPHLTRQMQERMAAAPSVAAALGSRRLWLAPPMHREHPTMREDLP